MTRLEELKAKMNNQPVATTPINTGTTRLDKLKSNLNGQSTSGSPTFKTIEEAKQYAKDNNIKIANENVKPLTLPKSNTVKTTINALTPEKAITSAQNTQKGAGHSFGEDTNNEPIINQVGKTIKQTLRNIGVGALSSGANTLEHFQDNNAITSWQAQQKAILNGMNAQIEQKKEDKNKSLSATTKATNNVNAYQNAYNQTMEEEAQKRYEDTDKVTQALRNVREREQLKTEDLPGIGKKVAGAGMVVGDMVPAIGAGLTLGPVASNLAIYGNAASNAYEQAIQNGATHKQAGYNALLSGALETGVEAIGGEGIAKLTKVPTLAGKLGSKIVSKLPASASKVLNNGIVRAGGRLLGDVTAEGFEEMISDVVQPYIDRLTYNPNAPTATLQSQWNAFTESILPTLMFAGLGAGSTQIEKIANKYGEKQIQQIEKSNATSQEKTQLKAQVEQMKQGAIQNAIAQEKNVSNIEQTPQNNTENVQNMVQTPNTLNSKEDLFSFRDFKEVGNKNVNAYQYDNPAVKPFFQAEAKAMLKDLNDTIRGERYYDDGSGTWGGVKRATTAEIAELLDGDNGVKLSYDDIKKGLNAIIEDNGAENNAKSKRIEFILDQRLRNGYTQMDGLEIPPDENYLKFLQGNEPQNTENINNIEKNSNQGSFSLQENLEKRLTGDKLLDAEDLIETVKGVGGNVDENGYVTVYHRTTPESAENILKTGKMNAKEDGLFFSSSQNGTNNSNYGESVIELKVPAEDLILDDIFDDEVSLKIPLKNKNQSIDVSKYIVNDKTSSIPENISQPQTSVPALEETNRAIQNNMNTQLANDTEALTLGKTKAKTPVEIANMTEEDIKREKGVEYKYKKDRNTPYQRKFFENMESSDIISKDVKERVDMTSYQRKANEQTLAKVNEKLDEKGDKLIKEWEKKTKNFTDEDVALGAILIQRYQQEGDIESAVDVVQKLADMGTEVGRAVQMYSIFQRLTPEAMMVYQQRKLNEVFNNLKQKKTGEWVEKNREKFNLTEEDAKFIQEQVEKAQNAETERQKQIELAKIESRINDKLPPEEGQSIKALRRLAMLFNPKTQVRNVVGNTLITPVNVVADAIGAQIDKAIAKKTGVRTTNYTNLKNQAEGFKKGIKESIEDYKLGIRTEPTGSKYEFEIGGKPFNENTKSEVLNAVNRKLNGLNNLLSAVMSGGDRPFYEAAFNNSLQGQMKANNVDTPTPEMIDIAVNEALSRTWNDNNSYTQAVLGIRSAMNKLNIKGFGLGDLIIPFAKTPANLTKAMVEYSPAGYIESLIDFNDMRKAISRGEMTPQQQKKFVTSTSKAIAGTILYAIAGSLAKSGKIKGSKDKDKDVANFEQNVLGIQPYSVKIGDKTYTYSWANPINAPLAIMADTYKMSKENASKFDILTNAFKVAGDTLVDNSFLQGIKELFEAESITEGIVNAVEDIPSQFVPTFLQQFANLGDKTKRQTFEYGDEAKTTLNSVKTKIPGLKNTLAPQVNTFGEEIENYGGDNNAFNVFLNPANINKANATNTQKELYSLYEATQDKTIFPIQAPYYISNEGQKTNLSSSDRATFQKASGSYVTKVYDALFDSEFYDKLDNEDKVSILKQVVEDSNAIGKASVGVETKNYKKLKEKQDILEKENIPLADYYEAWMAQKDVKAEKETNWLGKEKTIKTEKQGKIEAIRSAVADNTTNEQIEKMYDLFNLGVDKYNKKYGKESQ